MRLSPMLWATAALIAGILCASCIVPVAPVWAALLGVIFLAAAVLLRRRPIISLICCLIPVAAYGLVAAQLRELRAPNDVSRLAGRASLFLTGTVAAEPDRKIDDAVRYPLNITGTADGEPLSGKLWVTPVADAGPVPQFGDVIHIRGRVEPPPGATNPGGFDYAEYLRRHGVYALLTARRPGDVVIDAPSHEISVLSVAAGIRRALLDTIEHAPLPRDDTALASAVLLGEREGIPVDLDNALERSGAIHILSVSGLHLAVLAALLTAIARLLPPRRPIRVGWNIAVLALLWLFALAAGLSSATVRAATMVTILLLAPVFRRDADPRRSLVVAAFVMLLCDPMALYDPGAWLSFACLAGVLLWASPLSRRLLQPERSAGRVERAGRRLLTILLVGTAAQIAIVPLVAYNFSFVSLIAPLASLALIPIGAALLLVTLIASCIGAVVALPVAFWEPVRWLCDVLRAGAFLFAAPRWAAFALVPPPGWALAIFYMALVGLGIVVSRDLTRRTFFPKPKPRIPIWRPIVCSVLALIVLPAAVVLIPGWVERAEHQRSGRLRVTFLDVGQGDGTVIEAPDGAIAIVDGGGHPGTQERYGGDPGNRVVVPYLRYRGVNDVSWIVPTHPDDDHVQGLIAVAERVRVERALDGGVPDTGTDACARLRALLARQSIPVTLARRGEMIPLGTSGAILEVLHPADPLITGTRSDTNANSIVLRLHYHDAVILLTGDADESAEKSILGAGLNVRADVLKVGHHGSRFSSTPPFLQAVQPTTAVISVGANNLFGHPSPEVLDRLRAVDARIYRTDQQGAITLETDGKQVWLTPIR